MTERHELSPAAPWTELDVTDADWDAADRDLLTAMFSQLVLIRTFEETVLELSTAGLIHGPAHSSIGQEGGAVGSVITLTTARHGQRLPPGASPVPGQGARAPGPRRASTRWTTSAPTSAPSCSARWPRSAAWTGVSVTVAAVRCICSGRKPARSAPTRSSAAAYRWRPVRPGRTASPAPTPSSVTYFGDGASNIGSTLETFNLAAAWKLPICFFIENNQYAVSTNVLRVDRREPRLSARGPGFGIASWKVDGMNPLAVYLDHAGSAGAHAGR